MNAPAVDDGDRQLCAVLGHELRNPLAAASMSVTVVSGVTSEDDPRVSFLRRTECDLERLSALRTGDLEFGRGVRPHLAVHAGPGSLGRALDSRVDDALRAGATHVDVTTEQAGDRIQFFVDDGGPAVDDLLRDRIFEPFVSGRGSTRLGLAIAHGTIRAHGGRITCRANARGARSRIELPLGSEEGATA